MDDLYDDEHDYDLEYSEESTSEPDVDLENQYYLAKTMKQDNPKESLTAFQRVLELQEGTKGQWGFKALKQIVKINFQLKNYKETMDKYKELLSYINRAVTKNHGEKSINSILDYTSTSKDIALLKDFYETTLDALKFAKNDRLWFKTNTKLGKVYLERADYNKVSSIIKQLKQVCQWNQDFEEIDAQKGAQMLEIYALEIQMYTEQKNDKQLKQLYEKSLYIKSAIPHPVIMSVIRECGGKMHLRFGDYNKAYTDFFEAFKNYDESGNPRRITCLKYLLLTNMLTKSVINPFDSQEAKPYKNDPEIKAMTDLISAFQNNDTKEFERIFQENRESLMDDQFINEHIVQLLKFIRTEAVLSIIKPYKRIKISNVAEKLGMNYDETENLLVSCILDDQISARIDQIQGTLVKRDNRDDKKYIGMERLSKRLDEISSNIMDKLIT